MNYDDLNSDTARRLKLLTKCIKESGIPSSSLDESLNIATWNIRDFGKSERSDDAILFISQILFQFDLIAITELRDDLSDFKRVMNRLGKHWKYVISDWQDDWGGNWERTAFVYDERMVEFTGLAAEAQPDRKKNKTEYYSKTSWWRSPYMASFRAGDYDFIMMAQHARWGNKEGRENELSSFGNWIHERWDGKSGSVLDDDLIVVGDFNIPEIGDKFYEALTKESKLRMPKALEHITDTAYSVGEKRYDQILFRSSDKNNMPFKDKGGVIDFAKGDLLQKLFPETDEKKLTFELSDHFPLWIQIDIDNENQRLDSIMHKQYINT